MPILGAVFSIDRARAIFDPELARGGAIRAHLKAEISEKQARSMRKNATVVGLNVGLSCLIFF
jgi:hypothetical protein